MKKITFAMLIITFIMYIGLNFFSNEGIADVSTDNEGMRDSYLNIMVCNKSQYSMVKKIAGERHNIQYIFSSEADINKFKYDKNTVNNVSNMDLFMYSGNSYEPWDSKFIDELDKSKVGIVNISRGIRIMNYSNKAGDVNPYYWTGTEEYKIALYNIKNAIQDKDAKNREVYEDNYKNAIEYLDKSLSIYNNKKSMLNDFTFVLLDEKPEYFLRGLGINYSFVNVDNLEKYVLQKQIDKSKLIIIKDANNDVKIPNYNVISLESYNDGKSFEDIIFSNYKTMFSILAPDINSTSQPKK